MRFSEILESFEDPHLVNLLRANIKKLEHILYLCYCQWLRICQKHHTSEHD